MGRVGPSPTQAALHAASLYRQGRLDEAAQLYRAVLKADRNRFDCLYGLAVVRIAQHRLHEAIRLLANAVNCKPDLVEAHYELGRALLALDRPAEAVAHYQRVVALKPDLAEAHSSLGVAFLAAQRHQEAIEEFEKALAIKPGYAAAHNNLGLALAGLSRFEEAITEFEKAVALDPNFLSAHDNLGNALRETYRLDEAVQHYQKVVALKPDASAYAKLGSALLWVGRLAEARVALTNAIERSPGTAMKLHYELAQAKRFAAGDPQIATLGALAERSDALSKEDRIMLHFVLGKAHADLDEHERAFSHLLRGNSLMRAQTVYDEGATLDAFDRTRAIFTPELMQQKQGLGDPSALPVFIVGMPRSGTSLVEQILASHPAVFGAGELRVFGDAIGHVRRTEGLCAFPDFVPALSGPRLRALGARYLAGLPSIAAVQRITDKMPENFRFAGLIHLALPRARIIHVRRDPIDTCFSCFSLLFFSDQPHTYDLAELGRYYRAYQRLMAHWRALLPAEIMLEVQYEELVADLENQARRILAYCGLDWDPACLAFHSTPRAVRTASFAQVRRPLYQTSVARWKPYEKMLQPLIGALAE